MRMTSHAPKHLSSSYYERNERTHHPFNSHIKSTDFITILDIDFESCINAHESTILEFEHG